MDIHRGHPARHTRAAGLEPFRQTPVCGGQAPFPDTRPACQQGQEPVVDTRYYRHNSHPASPVGIGGYRKERTCQDNAQNFLDQAWPSLRRSTAGDDGHAGITPCRIL